MTDIGHDVMIYRPIGLECSTLFHKICGFHPVSLEVARYLNQPELALHPMQDDEVNMEISRNMIGCAPIPEPAMIVPWEQVKAYSDMLEDLTPESPGLNHDPLREAQIYEVNTDDKIDHNVATGAWLGGLTSGSSCTCSIWIRHQFNVLTLAAQGVAPMSRVSLAVYILGGIGTVLVDSLFIRAFLILGLCLYSWVSHSSGS
ncbi:hypothetical protein F5146DRAFT_1054586 [Armillaria mellea]|nr:hypothetical protein F5146DRAFT_1054586 [Armillaria mellea]